MEIACWWHPFYKPFVMKNRLLFGFLVVFAWSAVAVCDAASPAVSPAASPAGSFVSVASGHGGCAHEVSRPDVSYDGVPGFAARKVAAPEEESGLPMMTFLAADGSVRSVPADGLSMSFADGGLLVSSSDGSFEITVADLVRFYFSDDMSAVSSVRAEGAEAVDAYSPAGVPFGRFASGKEAALTLPSGLYILKSANRSSKIIVK